MNGYKSLIGIALIVVSYPLGWPAVGAFAGLAIYFKEPLIGIIGGPAVYIFSWGVLLAGIYLVRKDGYRRFREGGIKGAWKEISGTVKR